MKKYFSKAFLGERLVSIGDKILSLIPSNHLYILVETPVFREGSKVALSLRCESQIGSETRKFSSRLVSALRSREVIPKDS